MAAPESGDIFQPGDLLNNTYRIEAILGRGGTSEVYKARSEVSGKVVAIKALRAEFASNDDFLVLMTREEDVREIRHESVVRYFDTQRMPNGVVYLVMEFVDGTALDARMNDGGLRASELLVVGERVCAGLVAAHGRNIVHRDLSPDNIILRNDSPEEAVIIDFGIAKDTNPGAETIVGNEFAGKYAYAAPEQLAGQTDARSDIYSLGALLLATFRGKSPNVGNNPMEVVQKKAEPLDTEGVPEPLKTIIARMTNPDPNLRYQSAAELLEVFRAPEKQAAPEDALLGATVFVPNPADTPLQRSESTVPANPLGTIGVPQPKTAPAETSSGSKRLPVLALLALLVAAGGGALFSGLLDPIFNPLPVSDPYTLTLEKTAEGASIATGYVPSEDIQTALSTQMSLFGATPDLSLARGDINTNWGSGVLLMLNAVELLEAFRVEVTGNTVLISGTAATAVQRNAVQAAFASGFPEGFEGALDITVGPRFLPPETLEAVLGDHADCGRLRLPSPPPLGYSAQDTIIVTGRFAADDSRTALESELVALAGERPVRIEGEVLNESLCQIDALLPSVGPGGFDVRFGYGDRDAQNLSGRYRVGENPTIDIKLPETIEEGYLWVSVVDVQGVVFHVLPNRTRPDNDIPTLRSEAVDGFVRVAYGLDEARDTGRLAFNVDGSVLGKSKILVLESDEPLFDELRPTTESVASYADALKDARETGGLVVNHLDTAILTTEP